MGSSKSNLSLYHVRYLTHRFHNEKVSDSCKLHQVHAFIIFPGQYTQCMRAVHFVLFLLSIFYPHSTLWQRLLYQTIIQHNQRRWAKNEIHRWMMDCSNWIWLSIINKGKERHTTVSWFNGRYEKLRTLGKGNFGKVYLVRDRCTGKEV